MTKKNGIKKRGWDYARKSTIRIQTKKGETVVSSETAWVAVRNPHTNNENKARVDAGFFHKKTKKKTSG